MAAQHPSGYQWVEGHGLQLPLLVSGGSSFADNDTHPARRSVDGQTGSLRARESLGEQPQSKGVPGGAASERGSPWEHSGARQVPRVPACLPIHETLGSDTAGPLGA